MPEEEITRSSRYGTLLSLAFAIPSSLPCVEFLTSMATNNQPPLLNQAADVIVYDQSDGLFSELVDASSVISQNQTSTQQQHQLRSVQYGYPDQFILDDIPVKFYNYSSSFVICRWINNKGLYSQSHTWTLAPNEELMQHTTGGHVFLLTVVIGEEEAVLGAFRPKRHLPSGLHHSVQVHDGDNTNSSYILEVVLTHQPSYDALVVASFWINRDIVSKQTHETSMKTLNLLHKVLSNIIKDSTNERYRKLRLSNAVVSTNIGVHWSAMEFLRVLGFTKKVLANEEQGEEDEEYLIVENISDDTSLSLYVIGLALLEQLKSRCQNGFVADLAPRAPWDEPVLINNGNTAGRSGGGGRWGNAGSTTFVEDRWARVERARNFRRNAGPRPAPGNAPSDRGRWGRPR